MDQARFGLFALAAAAECSPVDTRSACPQSKFVSDTIRPASNFQAQARLTYDVEGFEPLGFIEAQDVVFLQHVSEIVSEVVCEKGVFLETFHERVCEPVFVGFG